MTKLRVGWHKEHFLSPLLQFAAQDKGEIFELVECPGGTGEMQVKLREGEIDVCIALTDALIAGLANGQTAYKLVGRYISSPLRWAVITGKNSQYNSISDLKGTTFGISRLGSGSQVMASVLGMNESWAGDEAPKFKGHSIDVSQRAVQAIARFSQFRREYVQHIDRLANGQSERRASDK